MLKCKPGVANRNAASTFKLHLSNCNSQTATFKPQPATLKKFKKNQKSLEHLEAWIPQRCFGARVDFPGVLWGPRGSPEVFWGRRGSSKGATRSSVLETGLPYLIIPNVTLEQFHNALEEWAESMMPENVPLVSDIWERRLAVVKLLGTTIES